MIPKLEAVIFDMDGLMLDTEILAIQSLYKAADAIGISLTDEIVMAIIGLNENDANRLIEKELGKPLDREKFSEAFYEDYYKRTILKGFIPIKAGLIELIDYLKENKIKLAVATSTKSDLALKKLTLAGIANRFEIVVGGDCVAQGKPAPDPYLKAAAQLGVDTKNCLALEDSDNGAMSAFTAGIRVIVVPDIKLPSPTTKKIASNICNSLSEVKLLLQDLAGRSL